MGFLPEESPLYEDMTPLSYLSFFADLYDVPTDAATERIHRTLDRLELDHRERRLGDISKGMRRKVAIARSLVNDPDVLIYDEPASGLDPLTTNYDSGAFDLFICPTAGISRCPANTIRYKDSPR